MWKVRTSNTHKFTGNFAPINKDDWGWIRCSKYVTISVKRLKFKCTLIKVIASRRGCVRLKQCPRPTWYKRYLVASHRGCVRLKQNINYKLIDQRYKSGIIIPEQDKSKGDNRKCCATLLMSCRLPIVTNLSSAPMNAALFPIPIDRQKQTMYRCGASPNDNCIFTRCLSSHFGRQLFCCLQYRKAARKWTFQQSISSKQVPISRHCEKQQASRSRMWQTRSVYPHRQSPNGRQALHFLPSTTLWFSPRCSIRKLMTSLSSHKLSPQGCGYIWPVRRIG